MGKIGEIVEARVSPLINIVVCIEYVLSPDASPADGQVHSVGMQKMTTSS